jgi:hypothetical protein
MAAVTGFVRLHCRAAVLLIISLSASCALPLTESESRLKSLQECVHRCVTRANNIQALHVCLSRHAREIRAENDKLRLNVASESNLLLSRKYAGSSASDEAQHISPKSEMFRAAMSLQKLRGGAGEKDKTTTATDTENTSYDFDYFVIGGGSGGVRSARIAATHGARVALAEAASGGDSAEG